jgi:hypothetical protein
MNQPVALDRLKRELALLRQEYERVSAKWDLARVGGNYPVGSEREEFLRSTQLFLGRVNACNNLMNHCLRSGEFVAELPPKLSEFYRLQVEPISLQLRQAFKAIDPDRYQRFALLDDLDDHDRIKLAFEVCLDFTWNVIEDIEKKCNMRGAAEILDSELIAFSPEEWHRNLSLLAPLLSARPFKNFPAQVRLRVEEVYRSFVFGNWLSVLALTRSLLEYSIHDNLRKLGIKAHWETTPKPREKKLGELIDEASTHYPEMVGEAMKRIRQSGNEYLHPKRRTTEQLFSRREEAMNRIKDLVLVIEILYNRSPTEETRTGKQG